MRVALTTLLILALAGTADAQVNIGTSRVIGGRVSAVASHNLDLRNYLICGVPDTQNMVSQSDFDAYGGAYSCAANPSFCVGENCANSKYCNLSWRNTGQILMNNLAYNLTGQWDRIDYSKIKAVDNVKSNFPNPPNHRKCDLIIGFGDMADVPNTSGYGNNIDNSLATLESEGFTYQFNTVREFWAIIDQSGIPYIFAHGNHDPWAFYIDLFDRLGVADKSYFYTKEPTYDLSYAILVPTSLGKPLCVINVAFSDIYTDAVGQPTRVDDTNTWLTATVGCGGDYPTIIVSHASVSDDPLTPALVDTITDNPIVEQIGNVSEAGTAGTSEIFMVMGGHHLGTESVKGSVTGLFGADADQSVFLYYSNFQEQDRHQSGTMNGISTTASDSVGGLYTLIDLQPDRDRLCAHDWNPYFQTAQGGSVNGQASNVTTSSGCQDFDFDVRFP